MNWRTSPGNGLLVVFLLTALSLSAQNPAPIPVPADHAALNSPDSRSAWTLEISTSGGLDGRGIGGFTLKSDGTLTCSLPGKCSGPIDVPSPVHGFVTAANLPPAKGTPGSNPSVVIPVDAGACMDCVVTTMLLRIRDSKGLEWTYSVTWNPRTLSSIPSDFKQVFQAAADLAK